MQKNTVTKRLVSIAELADALSVSVRTIGRLRRAGVIVPIQITAACPRYDLEKIIEDLRKQQGVGNAS